MEEIISEEQKQKWIDNYYKKEKKLLEAKILQFRDNLNKSINWEGVGNTESYWDLHRKKVLKEYDSHFSVKISEKGEI